MNWEFHAVQSTDSKKLMKEYRPIIIDALEHWIRATELGYTEEDARQEESLISEFPQGFYHEGPSYSFRFRVWGPGGYLGPAEYDVSVKQTFYPNFDKKAWRKAMKKRQRKRTRYIMDRAVIS